MHVYVYIYTFMHRLAYKTMIVNIMRMSGRSEDEAARDAHNVLAVETQLARAMKPPAQVTDALRYVF